MKHKLIKFKREMYNSTIVGEFHILHPIMDRLTRQQINKEKDDLNTMMQLDLTVIDLTVHLTTAEYIFPPAHGMFSTYETSLSKFKRIKNMPTMFPNDNVIKLEGKTRKEFRILINI